MSLCPKMSLCPNLCMCPPVPLSESVHVSLLSYVWICACVPLSYVWICACVPLVTKDSLVQVSPLSPKIHLCKCPPVRMSEFVHVSPCPIVRICACLPLVLCLNMCMCPPCHQRVTCACVLLSWQMSWRCLVFGIECQCNEIQYRNHGISSHTFSNLFQFTM